MKASSVVSHITVAFGAILIVLGCTATQKQSVQKALNATTQPLTTVQNDASVVATATPPGSLPNDIAQIVMAITGSLLVIERIANTVVANLPEKSPSDGSVNVGVAEVANAANSIEKTLNDTTTGANSSMSVHPSQASVNPNAVKTS